MNGYVIVRTVRPICAARTAGDRISKPLWNIDRAPDAGRRSHFTSLFDNPEMNQSESTNFADSRLLLVIHSARWLRKHPLASIFASVKAG
jgi:hypothetical protein